MQMSCESVLAVTDLTRHFGDVPAVSGLNLDLRRGEIAALLGPNGAGKSTSMRMIAGMLPPTRGSVRVAGTCIATNRRAAQRHLGYLPEGAPLYDEMTPADLLDFVGRCHALGGRARRARVGEAAERLSLCEVMARPIGALSKGYRRRVAFAAAILHDPNLLILDEPTDGLDPNQKHEVRRLLQELRHDRAILISTHLLEEVEAVCTRALVIAGGRLITDTTPSAMADGGSLDRTFRTLTGQEPTAPRSDADKAA